MTKIRVARRTNVLFLAGVQFLLLVATLAAAPQMVRRTVYVTALDRDGRPVPGLTADDFRVKEDGRVRGIAQVEVATQPMQIALLLDDGGPSLAAIRQSTGQFVERLQRKAEFSLTTTGGQPQTRVNPTADPRQIYDALKTRSPTPLPRPNSWTPSWKQPATLCAGASSRAVIVAIVSEGEELSTSRADVVLDAIQQSGAVFYYIGLGTPVTSGTQSFARCEPRRGFD